MGDTLQFAGREEFRSWLFTHCLEREGVWLLFGKPGGPKTIKAGEALEEALCFGLTDRCRAREAGRMDGGAPE